MKVIIDTEASVVSVERGTERETVGLYTARAFELLSEQWIRIGWQLKYSYRFTWMGRPIIQLPEDLIRVQEAIHRVQPDVIIETGVAHGGSLIFYASLCKAMERGRVIGVDIDIRPHNRDAINAHPLAPLITLVEGSSVDRAVVERVRSRIRSDETVLVLLDSNHSRDHVAAELEAYAPLVTTGSYIVATDGIMRDVAPTPRGKSHWITDNPATAAREFAARHPEFVLELPMLQFDQSEVIHRNTYWPDAWLRRVR
jgi:cephalosporin hydroxylase